MEAWGAAVDELNRAGGRPPAPRSARGGPAAPFRWRYERAIEAPSRGSVYRLFPGGWAEVLDETRQEAGATV